MKKYLNDFEREHRFYQRLIALAFGVVLGVGISIIGFIIWVTIKLLQHFQIV